MCSRDGSRTSGPAGAPSSSTSPSPGSSCVSGSADPSPALSTGDFSENGSSGVSLPRRSVGGATTAARPAVRSRAASSRLPRPGCSEVVQPPVSSSTRLTQHPSAWPGAHTARTAGFGPRRPSGVTSLPPPRCGLPSRGLGAVPQTAPPLCRAL